MTKNLATTSRSKALNIITVLCIIACTSNAERSPLKGLKSPIFGLHQKTQGRTRLPIIRGGSNLHLKGNHADNLQEINATFEVDTQLYPVPTKDADDAEYKKALTKTALTVAAAALFGIGVMATKGVSSGYEFFAGYLIEQSLSIDNLFVFIMLFEYFKIPMELQNRVLSWGIGGAIILRGLMIGVGVAALQQFRSVILVFAAILIASSVNLLFEKEHDDSAAGENIIMKFTKFIFPNTSTELHGEDFFVTNETGKKIATPLFLCLVCVELSDFVFAVDSIPAVLGVSKDPLIVYASNIFAIMVSGDIYLPIKLGSFYIL